MINSPCLNCSKRFVGCHSTCDDYILYRNKLKEYKDYMNQNKSAEATIETYVCNSVLKNKRISNK